MTTETLHGQREEVEPAESGTLSRQIEELRAALGDQPDGVRRRIDVVAAIATAFEEQLRTTRRSSALRYATWPLDPGHTLFGITAVV